MPRQYTNEFKQNIIQLHQKGIKSAKQLSVEYGVGYSTVLKWVQFATPTLESGITPDQAKSEAKRIKELEEEVEILKKRWGYSRGNKLPLSIYPRPERRWKSLSFYFVSRFKSESCLFLSLVFPQKK